VFEEFKKLADKKKEIYDGDIVALIEKEKPTAAAAPRPTPWKPRSWPCSTPQTASRRKRTEGREWQAASSEWGRASGRKPDVPPEHGEWRVANGR
jgi:hypothetical protein